MSGTLVTSSLILAAGLLQGHSVRAADPLPVATEAEVQWPALKVDLQGYGYNTTGGLNGNLYVVTSLADYDVGETAVPGTLRYGIEKSDKTKPLWIRFDSSFGSTEQKLILKRTLRIDRRGNVTIDGRGVNIALTRSVDWSLYHEIPQGSRTACAKNISSTPGGDLLVISSYSNIILTHLKLTRDNYTSPFASEVTLDKECLGDLVSIFNNVNIAGARTANIWINRVWFEHCGDGCLDVTRPAPVTQGISISNNTFSYTDKTTLAGGAVDVSGAAIPVGKYYYRFSFYGNHYFNTVQRNPRVTNAIAHIYNNFWEGTKNYMVGNENSRVFVEKNRINTLASVELFQNINANSVTYIFSNKSLNGPRPETDTPNYTTLRDSWINVPFTVQENP